MEQINAIELADERIYPDEVVLQRVLGDSFGAYSRLLDLFAENELTTEWRYYKDGKAWLGKVQRKKRTVVWMSAWKGFMKATIYFPDRCADSLLALDLRPETKERMTSVKPVGKSLPCMFEVRNDEVLKDLETVMRYKISLK